MKEFTATRVARFAAAIATWLAIASVAGTAAAESAAELDREATAALKRLYAHTPAAKTLGGEAVGIMVFPQVSKAGFIFAGEFGVGALR
jgi:lipid-binding SYLF domain-containing protein